VDNGRPPDISAELNAETTFISNKNNLGTPLWLVHHRFLKAYLSLAPRFFQNKLNDATMRVDPSISLSHTLSSWIRIQITKDYEPKLLHHPFLELGWLRILAN
jgi:hypothetical protein